MIATSALLINAVALNAQTEVLSAALETLPETGIIGTHF